MKRSVSVFALSAVLWLAFIPLALSAGLVQSTIGKQSPIIQGNYNVVKINEKTVRIIYEHSNQVIYQGVPHSSYDSLIRKWEQSHQALIQEKEKRIAYKHAMIGVGDKAGLEGAQTSSDGSTLKPLSGNGKKTFMIKGHPKSRGVQLSMEYPESWSISEDPDPTMVQRFAGNESDGIIQACTLNISPIPEDMQYKSASNLFSKNTMRHFLPHGAVYILSAQKEFSELPGGWMTYSQDIKDSVGVKSKRYMHRQTMLYRDSAITLMCGVTGNKDKNDTVAGVFNKEIPVFEAMGNSIAIQRPPKSLVNADFQRYIPLLQQRIRRYWIPSPSPTSNTVKVLFTVTLNGELVRAKILQSSGLPKVDKAAMEAIKHAAPFEPLPSGYERDSIDVNFFFDYKVVPKYKGLGPALLRPLVPPSR